MPKCRICKANITNKDDYIKLGNAYYHTKEYRLREQGKLIPDEDIEKIIADSKELLKIENEKKSKSKDLELSKNREKFITWIQENYYIKSLPTQAFRKLAEITNGTKQGLKEGISYIDLLDMFQRKKPSLDVQLAKKTFKNELYRFYYDLTIMVNQYDSYKKWQNAKVIETQDAIERNKQNIPEIPDIKRESVISIEPTIADMTEDIFGD